MHEFTIYFSLGSFLFGLFVGVSIAGLASLKLIYDHRWELGFGEGAAFVSDTVEKKEKTNA